MAGSEAKSASGGGWAGSGTSGARLAARLSAHRRLAAWGAARADVPVLWLHGASAGELLSAVPIVAALRERRRIALVTTHTSPSARIARAHLAPDFAGYAPLDLPGPCRAAVARVRPALLVYVRGDVWPALTVAADRAGVPVALVNAGVREGSHRLRPLARWALRGCYGRLSLVAATGEKDAARLRSLGVREEALRIGGDTAFDAALMRAGVAIASALSSIALPGRPPGGARLVAGSTWPEDETALLDALATMEGDERFRWQVAIAPHRPGEAHVRRLLGECRRRREPVARQSDPEAVARLPAHGIVIHDRVGDLPELYALGDVAYVGGGLDGRGLHNVLEPAAAGLPVLFGGRHDREDARGLVETGGGRAVSASELTAALRRLTVPVVRSAAGDRARTFVRVRAGNVGRLAEELLALAPAAGRSMSGAPTSSGAGRPREHGQSP